MESLHRPRADDRPRNGRGARWDLGRRAARPRGGLPCGVRRGRARRAHLRRRRGQRHRPDRRDRDRLVRRFQARGRRPMSRLVLVGGGHGHVEVLRDLAENPAGAVDATLVTPYPWLTYTGMVPGLFAGHYEIDQCTIDLRALAERARVSLVQANAIRIDTADREVVCDNGATVPYEVLSLDVGTVPYGAD